MSVCSITCDTFTIPMLMLNLFTLLYHYLSFYLSHPLTRPHPPSTLSRKKLHFYIYIFHSVSFSLSLFLLQSVYFFIFFPLVCLNVSLLFAQTGFLWNFLKPHFFPFLLPFSCVFFQFLFDTYTSTIIDVSSVLTLCYSIQFCQFENFVTFLRNSVFLIVFYVSP